MDGLRGGGGHCLRPIRDALSRSGGHGLRTSVDRRLRRTLAKDHGKVNVSAGGGGRRAVVAGPSMMASLLCYVVGHDEVGTRMRARIERAEDKERWPWLHETSKECYDGDGGRGNDANESMDCQEVPSKTLNGARAIKERTEDERAGRRSRWRSEEGIEENEDGWINW